MKQNKGFYIPFDIKLIQKYFDILEKNGILLIKNCVLDRIFLQGIFYKIFQQIKNKFSHIHISKKQTVTIRIDDVNKKLGIFINENKDSKVLMKKI